MRDMTALRPWNDRLNLHIDCVLPSEYRLLAKEMDMMYDFVDTSFGQCIVLTCKYGLCAIEMCHDKKSTIEIFTRQWEPALLKEGEGRGKEIMDNFFAGREQKLSLWLRGTPFQTMVWRTLLTIPAGTTTSYHDIARKIGEEKAVRAVGTAIGHNPISLIVPCHRVLRSNGGLGGYRWGLEMKSAVLSWEKNIF